MVLYFECGINKKTLLQTVFFFAILPTGKGKSNLPICCYKFYIMFVPSLFSPYRSITGITSFQVHVHKANESVKFRYYSILCWRRYLKE